MLGSGAPPLRIERVLRLLPDVEALMPLRAFLVSTSRPASDPYATVGKRYVQPSELRGLVPLAVARVTTHLNDLYEAAVEAVEAEQRGDLAQTVEALTRAGTLEEGAARYTQARAWYNHALSIAEGLRDRRPEVSTLRCSGQLEFALDNYDRAAQFFQRSLALAEAEFEAASATHACEGLGQIHIAQGRLQGAESWFTRGLHYASDDSHLEAPLYLGLGEVARHREQPSVASEQLHRAREMFEQHENHHGVMRALNERGQLEASMNRYDEALASYREALGLTRMSSADHTRLEMTIRLNVCRLHCQRERFPDAEDEIRRAEETAIVHNFTQHLAGLYLLMGEIRGLQHDDTGFIFFEKAVELCRGPELSPRLEGEVYLAYGQFHLQLGNRDEGRAHLERSREILSSLGDGPLLAKVEADLAQFEMT